jgi:predicted Zn-dependent peptidase
MFAGNIDEEEIRDLSVRYLASIPAQDTPQPRKIANVTPMPYRLPQKPMVVEVPLRMKEAIAEAQVTFPGKVCTRSSPSFDGPSLFSFAQWRYWGAMLVPSCWTRKVGCMSN